MKHSKFRHADYGGKNPGHKTRVLKLINRIPDFTRVRTSPSTIPALIDDAT